MAYAVAFEDVKSKVLKRKNPEHKGYKLALFGSKENPELPHATYNQHEPGVYFNSAHFHSCDQFQVTIEGKFKIGRHELTPYCVHFTRAYTPYGPLVSEGTPFTFVVMRAHLDEGSQHLPQQMEKLQRATQRQPWQITRKVSIPQFGANATDILLRPIPDIVDGQGLAAYTLNMKPNAVADAPDPSIGDGQYLVVVKGSVIHERTEKKAFALIFVRPQEGPYRLHAGAEGLEAIVLNFPQVKTRAAHPPQPSRAPGFKKWQCELCSFAYDEALGLPDEGIAPGTRWEDIPETWSCPDCSTSKSDFRMVEVAS